MEELFGQIFGSFDVTLNIWVLLAALIFAFTIGVRIMWAYFVEVPMMTKRMKKNELIDVEQQQAIEELKRAQAVLQDENRTLEARVSASSILLTSVTAKRLGF